MTVGMLVVARLEVRYAKADELEVANLAVQRLLHEQLERCFRAFVLETRAFELLDFLDNGARSGIRAVDIESELSCFVDDIAATREIGNENALHVAD
jgi:hypothetical protein